MFRGWIGFSQWVKKEFRYYPKRELLVELAKMSKAERAEGAWFGCICGRVGKKGGSLLLLASSERDIIDDK